MTTLLDLEPATLRMAALVRGVRDEQLRDPTPCAETNLGDLLDHVDGLALAFTAAATKTGGDGAPSADGSRLGDDWRTRIPRRLDALAQAWRDPEAWKGTTAAGGIELPGEAAGVIALDELVIHGWDVARASGQPFGCEPADLDAVHGFVAQFADPAHPEARAGLFGPVVAIADDAPLLDRVLALTGRDPSWSPA